MKQRYINTRFWNDSYVAELDPVEKLLFIYFLTNEHTNISGIYEVPMKVMAVETGLDTTMLHKVLPRLKDKIRYVDGRVVIKNFIKHQEGGSEQVRKGIINSLKEIPRDFLINVISKGFFVLPSEFLDTLGIPSDTVSIPPEQSKSISRSKQISKSISKSTSSAASVAEQETQKEELNSLIALFEAVNPSYAQLFARKPQRQALERLLKLYGREKVEWMIKILPKSNQARYGPTITTPLQLEEKLGALIVFLKKESYKPPGLITV